MKTFINPYFLEFLTLHHLNLQFLGFGCIDNTYKNTKNGKKYFKNN